MSAITGVFKVNADGNVVIPVGPERAGSEVEVSVNPLEESQLLDRLTDEEWRRRVAETAGAITDPTFRRHDKRASEMTADEYAAFIDSMTGNWIGEFPEIDDAPPEEQGR